MSIGEKIKEAMKLRDVNQNYLVQRTGLTAGAISSYLSGRYEPRRLQIKLLADALDVNPLWLMEIDNAPMQIKKQTTNFTDEEISIIEAYRNHPDMHTAVKTLLGVSLT